MSNRIALESPALQKPKLLHSWRFPEPFSFAFGFCRYETTTGNYVIWTFFPASSTHEELCCGVKLEMWGTQHFASLSKKRSTREVKERPSCLSELLPCSGLNTWLAGAALSRAFLLYLPQKKSRESLSFIPLWRNSISSTICSDLCRDPEPRASTSVCSCGALNKPGSKMILHPIKEGKNNSEREDRSDKKWKNSNGRSSDFS